MSREAWGDEGQFHDHDGYVTEEVAEDAFRDGLQAMREMLAQFVEQGGDPSTAASLRANWNPDWGKDPGRPDSVKKSAWS